MLPPTNYRVSCDFRHVPAMLERYERDQVAMGYRFLLIPDFQRGHVWSTAQKSRFVEWLLIGGDTSPIIFNHPAWNTDYRADMVCVDGLQRLTAICDFMAGGITAFDAYVDAFTKRQLQQARMLTFAVMDLSEKECLEMYIRINSGGTIHSKAEINKVKAMLTAYD